MSNNRINFKGKLQQDDLFVNSQILPLSTVCKKADGTGYEGRQGFEKVIICNDKIVNIVGENYGHLDNKKFFGEMEAQLIGAGINYDVRSINRQDRSFAADYILNDANYEVKVHNGLDKLKPMLRLTNSYDGSIKSGGNFGFFREVCTNGLHVAHTNVGFSIKHTGNIVEVVFPKIQELVAQFLDNEYYTLVQKFETLATKPISDVQQWVNEICNETNIFKFAASDKNPEPSKNAQQVIDTITLEAALLNAEPNLWLGYNAFNEILHGKFVKSFTKSAEIDMELFETVLAAN